MTLGDVGSQHSVRVTEVQGGYGLRRRLSRLGISEGDTVTVVSRAAFRGPVLVEVRGTRIAVGQGVARKIGVTPVGAPAVRRAP